MRIAKKNARHKLKRTVGRPATGHDPTFAMRLPKIWLEQIDDWATELGITRAEAIRRLLKLGWNRRRPRGAKGE